ncbi:MAG: nuclear transport factor 2 family protein [Rhodospirillaceae bacterium]|nr:nuclear transport factor 2 family protein [Rhodospirillaceae bacterium]
MRRGALVLLAALLALPAAAETEWRGGSAADRAEIKAIIAKWEKAYATGDGQAVADGYDPKGYVMAENAPIAGPDKVAASLIRTFANNDIKMLLDVMEVEFNGTEVGGWAFIAGRFASKRTPKAATPGVEPRYHAGHFFTLMRKTDAGWKVWRNVDTSSPDANYLLDRLKQGQ